MTPDDRCDFQPCNDEAAYVIRYEDDSPSPAAACVTHTAEARATDPLEYIVGVRRIGRTA